MPGTSSTDALQERRGERLAGVDWYGEEVSDVRFVDCDFSDADLTEARTERCTFEECDFSGVRLNISRHERSAFLRCRFRRTSFFDATLAACKLSGSRFEAGCLLRPMTVDGGDWSYVVLRGQDLSGLSLRGVRLTEADLSMATLTGVDLRDALLSRAELRGAVCTDTDLRGADLSGVDLTALDLRGAHIDLAQAVALAEAHGMRVDVT